MFENGGNIGMVPPYLLGIYSHISLKKGLLGRFKQLTLTILRATSLGEFPPGLASQAALGTSAVDPATAIGGAHFFSDFLWFSGPGGEKNELAKVLMHLGHTKGSYD